MDLSAREALMPVCRAKGFKYVYEDSYFLATALLMVAIFRSYDTIRIKKGPSVFFFSGFGL
ncbi:MAG: hypothetical protein WBI82_07035 [Sphaerochaeta sp.]